MRIVMIIPAKGSSVRIPGKNKKLFCKHPLVAWSIVQGVQAKQVDEVWVSTDDDEIANIAKWYGAKVMFRDYEDDVETPGDVPVKNWTYRMVASGALQEEDMMIFRLCTTPTLLPHDTDAAIDTWRFLHEHYGAMGIIMGAEQRTFSAARKVVDNITRALSLDCRCENSGEIVRHYAAFGLQNVGAALEEWQMTAEAKTFRELHQGDYPRSFYYNLQEWQLTDVDTPEEWEFAELIAEHYILKGRDMVHVYTQ